MCLRMRVAHHPQSVSALSAFLDDIHDALIVFRAPDAEIGDDVASPSAVCGLWGWHWDDCVHGEKGHITHTFSVAPCMHVYGVPLRFSRGTLAG